MSIAEDDKDPTQHSSTPQKADHECMPDLRLTKGDGQSWRTQADRTNDEDNQGSERWYEIVEQSWNSECGESSRG